MKTLDQKKLKMKHILRLLMGTVTVAFIGANASALPLVEMAELVSADAESAILDPFITLHTTTIAEDNSASLLVQNATLDEISARPGTSLVSNVSTTSQPLSGAALVTALQQGGYIIVLRHAQTEQDFRDDNAKIGNCATQRMLSAVGWQQARTIGHAFEVLDIPVGAVYSSEYCRAWQTADLAFGHHETRPALNSRPGMESSEALVSEVQAQIMPLLTTAPASGTNTVLVSHYDVFFSTVGMNLENQGTAYVIRPDGRGSFEVITRMEPDEWGQLARSQP